MIGGLDIYIRNSIIYYKVKGKEYVIVCGKDDKHQPVIRKVEIGYLLTLDTAAYADRIIQLVNDKELRTSMVEKSRVLFLDEFFTKKIELNTCKINIIWFIICNMRGQVLSSSK